MIRFLLIFALLTSCAYAVVTDEFAKSTLNKDLKIPPAFQLNLKDSPVEYKPLPEIFMPVYKDNLVETTLKDKHFEKPLPNLNYDYSDMANAVIKIRPVQNIKSNKNFHIGQIVEFTAVEDVFYEGRLILSKNTPISAVIENISPNERYGAPASLVISRFSSPNLDNKTLDGHIDRQGKNFSLWVYPLSYVLSPFGGFALTFIRGGNVKIKTTDVLEIYYRPTRFKKGL